MKNDGQKREDEMIFFLNGKKYKDLSYNLQKMLQTFFGLCDPEETVTCTHALERTKPDLIIHYMGRDKYVSMKSGTSCQVHSENIFTFVDFLRSLGVKESTIEIILLFQFGDGTTDGTGKERFNLADFKFKQRKRFKEASDDLNSDSEIISEVFKRCVFQGLDNTVPAANALYHGTYEHGIGIVKKQVTKYIAKPHHWDWMDSMHIGPLTFRPACRQIDDDPVHKEKRFKIQISLPNMYDDMKYIDKTLSSYTPERFRTYDE